jgi:hypothetical protein
MKKIVFSLMILVALVVMAGSSMAQTNVTPYPGGTYSYTLSGIKTNSIGAAVIAITGADATIKNVEGIAGDYTGGNIPTPAAADFELNFDISYGLLATGTRKITVTVTDGAASGGCSNFIELEVVINALPTLVLDIVASETDYCQNKNTAPLTDNTAATVGAPVNEFTFTVTPTITDVTSAYTYEYKITLPNDVATGLTAYAITHTSGNGAYDPSTGIVTGSGTEVGDATPDVFKISFTTTTGIAPVDVNGTLADASITITAGGSIITGTFTNTSDAVSVKTMPSIGTFN